jgi:tRNA-modifying protein YgfZ
VIVAPDNPEVANAYVDPRLSAIGWRAIVPMGGLQAGSGYDRARIRLGLADSQADLGSGEFYPQEANLDLLGAVSFDKGCYIGQEVVSRMQHRGSARSRILPVRLEATAPEKGSEVLSGGRNVGALLSSQGTDALAILRLDRLAEAKEALLTQGVKMRVIKPAWVRYDVPRAEEGGQ